MSSARHAELLEKVQTVSALNDSNRMLREERDKFAVSVTEIADKLSAAEERLKPVQERLAAVERREEDLKVGGLIYLSLEMWGILIVLWLKCKF